ncbi:MAG: 2-iminoacetate synthase ThiH [Candidatus Ancaeobacter aquaticus]|nr:2-iminoacetate synthase ThiH [Candidatus Ancaeobacter aquaticus]
MSFYTIYNKLSNYDFDSFFRDVSSANIEQARISNNLKSSQYLWLLSPLAEKHLEKTAQRSHALTVQNFGKTIQLYTPLYLSNYCENQCVYCGFNEKNTVERKQLTIEELEKEARYIAQTGLKHILVLTGDLRAACPVSYIAASIKILRKYFTSISIEIYPLSESEYKELIAEGIDGLTIYQEVYDRAIYGRMHLKGPKKDYEFRMAAPERALSAGIRTVNIGALFGLNDWRKEAFFVGMHAKYLQDTYPEAEVSISLPRVQTMNSAFSVPWDVTDKNMVQIITALRIYLPRVGITISTRETASLRDNLLPLGVTKMSAGSTTAVGGHTADGDEEINSLQFDISDKRNVHQIRALLKGKGYQPVLKDWM